MDDSDLERWLTLLNPYYDDLHVRRGYENNCMHGYERQQFTKLSLPVSEPYLTLDCKNFFTRATDLSEYELPGNGLPKDPQTTQPIFSVFRERVLDYTGVDPNSRYWAIETPFVIDPSCITPADLEWFRNQCFKPDRQEVSEFLFYGHLYVREHGEITVGKKYHSLLWHCDVDFETQFEWATDPHIAVSGFHRGFLEHADQTEIDRCREWLCNLNLMDDTVKGLFNR